MNLLHRALGRSEMQYRNISSIILGTEYVFLNNNYSNSHPKLRRWSLGFTCDYKIFEIKINAAFKCWQLIFVKKNITV